jgi:hypothetical protein
MWAAEWRMRELGLEIESRMAAGLAHSSGWRKKAHHQFKEAGILANLFNE